MHALPLYARSHVALQPKLDACGNATHVTVRILSNCDLEGRRGSEESVCLCGILQGRILEWRVVDRLPALQGVFAVYP